MRKVRRLLWEAAGTLSCRAEPFSRPETNGVGSAVEARGAWEERRRPRPEVTLSSTQVP